MNATVQFCLNGKAAARGVKPEDLPMIV